MLAISTAAMRHLITRPLIESVSCPDVVDKESVADVGYLQYPEKTIRLDIDGEHRGQRCNAIQLPVGILHMGNSPAFIEDDAPMVAKASILTATSAQHTLASAGTYCRQLSPMRCTKISGRPRPRCR